CPLVVVGPAHADSMAGGQLPDTETFIADSVCAASDGKRPFEVNGQWRAAKPVATLGTQRIRKTRHDVTGTGKKPEIRLGSPHIGGIEIPRQRDARKGCV